jgi:hypothetical protein
MIEILPEGKETVYNMFTKGQVLVDMIKTFTPSHGKLFICLQ